MTRKETFSVRLDPEDRERLDAVAAAMDRSRSYVVKEAVEQYLTYHGWKAREVQKGMEARQIGRTVPHDEVFARLRRRFGDSAGG